MEFYNHKSASNTSGTRESAANAALALITPAAGPGQRVLIDEASVSIKAAAAGADINIYCRVQSAAISAYTYTDGTGVVSAITFSVGGINDLAVGSQFADDGTPGTFYAITAIDTTAGAETFTVASGASATLNGGAGKTFHVVQDVIGSAAARGAKVSLKVGLRSCKNGLARLDVDAGGAACVTVGTLPYRFGGA